MKTLTVTLRVELEIPDDWQLVDHPSGIQVLKVGDAFVDFDIAPLATRSTDPDAEWTDADEAVVGDVLDAVTGLEAEFEIRSVQ
jgi:hypothetical protein